MISTRPANGGIDHERLGSLRCSDGSPYQDAVEAWVRAEALVWAYREPDHYLILSVDDDYSDDLVAACAFQRDHDRDKHWFINALAVARHRQGVGHGRRLLTTCLDRMAQSTPGGSARWRVAPGDRAAHQLSRTIGAEVVDVPQERPFAVYFVRFA